MSLLTRLLWAAAGIALVLVVTISTMRKPEDYARTPSASEVVAAFNHLAFEARQPRQAVLEYFSADAVDHDPSVQGDRQSIANYLERDGWAGPAPTMQVVRSISDKEFVVVHSRYTLKDSPAATAAVDIYRVANGFIAEHWGVHQPVPSSSVNTAPMF